MGSGIGASILVPPKLSAPAREPKMTAVIKKSAFVVTLRLDLFDLNSGTDPLRNPTATSLARKMKASGSWPTKDKWLAALSSLAVAQAKPACLE